MLRIVVTLLVLLDVMLAVRIVVTMERARESSQPHAAIVPAPPPPVPVEYATKCNRAPPKGFDGSLVAAATEFGIDPKVLFVTVLRESGCHVRARGSSGEIGLGQVLPRVWVKSLREAGILEEASDLWDVRTNLRASAYILSRLLTDADGDTYGMFRRYNGSGPKARQYAREQVRALASL